MQSLKVLVAVSCFPPSKGGVERASFRLAMGLVDLGHSVTVVTSSRGMKPGTYTEMLGPLRVIRYPETRFLFDSPLVPRIALAALTEDYDVLHVHGMTPTLTDLSILFAKLRGKRVVLTYHNDAESALHGTLGRLAGKIYSKVALPVVRMADQIVSATYSYAATSPVLRHIIDTVRVIPWGTDFWTAAEESKREARDHKRVLFVGQLKHYKGVQVLLDSIALLNGSGHFIKTDIVGDGPAAAMLKSKARELNLEERVKFWGSVDDEKLRKMYMDCDIVTLPSLNRREAFGLALLDALAAGKPVVASDIPGVKEVALLGGGQLARPNDPGSLSECIIKAALAEPPPAERIRQGVEGLTWENVVVKYGELIQSSSGASSPAGTLR